MEKGREAEELGKILVIAEKPSVARDIAKVLKAGQKGDGCLIGEEYVVSSANPSGRNEAKSRSENAPSAENTA